MIRESPGENRRFFLQQLDAAVDHLMNRTVRLPWKAVPLKQISLAMLKFKSCSLAHQIESA